MTPVQIPDFLRLAMEAQGKVDPDEVAAKAAEIQESGELNEPEQPKGPRTAPPAPVDDGQESLLGVMPPVTLDPEAGAKARDAGMARADNAADPEWKTAAWDAIVALANIGEDFTADDVWVRVGFMPAEPRALGPILSRAQKAGMIRNSGQRRNSARPEHHAFPCAVWTPCG